MVLTPPSPSASLWQRKLTSQRRRFKCASRALACLKRSTQICPNMRRCSWKRQLQLRHAWTTTWTRTLLWQQKVSSNAPLNCRGWIHRIIQLRKDGNWGKGHISCLTLCACFVVKYILLAILKIHLFAGRPVPRALVCADYHHLSGDQRVCVGLLAIPSWQERFVLRERYRGE